jgi:hypothetical protein
VTILGYVWCSGCRRLFAYTDKPRKYCSRECESRARSKPITKTQSDYVAAWERWLNNPTIENEFDRLTAFWKVVDGDD